jgi:hypothetical protein
MASSRQHLIPRGGLAVTGLRAVYVRGGSAMGQPFEVRVKLDKLVSCFAQFPARRVLPEDDSDRETPLLQ